MKVSTLKMTDAEWELISNPMKRIIDRINIMFREEDEMQALQIEVDVRIKRDATNWTLGSCSQNVPVDDLVVFGKEGLLLYVLMEIHGRAAYEKAMNDAFLGILKEDPEKI